MPELMLDEVSLHYEISGQGPPLLLIAGFMSDGASWAPLLPLLEPHFTLIRPDNRSTGQTTPWNAPCNPPIWAADAVALLNHLDIDRLPVFGHSLGGLIGWQMAYDAPDRLSHLMTCGSTIRHFDRNTALFRALIAVRRSNAPEDTWLRLLFPWLFSNATYEQPGLIDMALANALAYPHAQSVDAMVHQLAALQGVDPTPFAHPPNAPLRALLAAQDMLIPLDLALESLKGVDTRVIEGAGHSIHWDAPETVARHVLEFLQAH